MMITALVVSVGLMGQPRAGDSAPLAPPKFAPRFKADSDPAATDTETPRNSDPGGRFRNRESEREPTPRHFGTGDAGDEDVVAVEKNRNPRTKAPEIIAEALATVLEDGLEGEKLRLIDAIKRSRDRNQQIAIVQVYWRLALAQADYHYSDDAMHRMQAATKGEVDNNPALHAARCAVRALKRDAQALVVRAQNDLATQMALAPGEPMPLAADKPHGGGYRDLKKFFEGRAVPPRATLIIRTIPIRVLAINEHAEAVVATTDSVNDTIAAFLDRQTDLTTLLASFERLWKERKAFTAAVKEYNQDLAELVITAAAPNADPASIVKQLILTDTSSHSLGPEASLGRPRGRLSEPVDDEALANSPDEGGASPKSAGGQRTKVRRPVDLDEESSQRALWYALLDVETPLRTQRLSLALNSEEGLPRDIGQPVILEDCLRRSTQQTRRGILAAYWRAREAAAVYQVLTDELNELTALGKEKTRIHANRGGGEAGVRLDALSRSVKAAAIDSRIDLLLEQFDLTTYCNARLDEDWLLPATPPHAGRYLLHLDEQPQELVEERRLAQLGTLVLVLHAQMEDHASTVVFADAARAMALHDPGSAVLAFDTAMGLIERQAAHTVFFLRATTKYNLAIADYVLAIMPEDVSPSKLASALVVKHSRTVGS